MIAKENNKAIEIYLTADEVVARCKPGTYDCCIWLMIGPQGWECVQKCKPRVLVERFEKGLTNAKRDGCDLIKNWVPPAEIYLGQEIEIKSTHY